MKIKLFGQETDNAAGPDFPGDHPPTLVKTYEIHSTRGSFTTAATETLTEEDLLEFHFEDDTVWYAGRQDLPALFGQTVRSEGDELIIPNYIDTETGERGRISRVFLKLVRFFKLKGTDQAALKIAEGLEARILQEGLFLLSPNFKLQPYEAGSAEGKFNPEAPILLLLHGTSSNTQGSFGGLKQSKTWEELVKTYGRNILTCEHRTWSKSPFVNAAELLERLPKGITLHLLSHSRGGIIGDLLARCGTDGSPFTEEEQRYLTGLGREEDAATLERLNRVAAEKNIRVDKFVRVACPAAGTTLLSKRLDHFLNFLLNAVGYGAGQQANPLFVAVRSLLTALVANKEQPDVLPGLEAMMPESPLQNILNNHLVSIDGELVILAGDAGPGNVKKSLVFLLSRLYYLTDNDFVVDTDSMFEGVPRNNKVYYRFVSGKTVDHFSYFLQADTRRALLTALTGEPRDLPDFKVVRRGEQNRAVLHGGHLYPVEPSGKKPVLVLLPGIMGSNLYEGEEAVWIHYRRMIGNGLLRLTVDNEAIRAKSVVETAYGKFVQHFSDRYDVRVFPFDWRLSLTEAAGSLAAELTRLREREQPIRIVAHSMGGLVVRELIRRHGSLWQDLRRDTYFRCILLGTPWQGSYLIPEVITGYSRRIRTIAKLALFKTKKELLEVFVRYPGLWELLPTDAHAHAFEQMALWKALAYVTDDDSWALPTEASLRAFANYKKKVRTDDLDLGGVIYVAGYAEQTVSNFVFRDEYRAEYDVRDAALLPRVLHPGPADDPRTFELVFKATNQGDGSVTWATGIPPAIREDPERLYYMDTTHMELANDERYFPALAELLEKGRTTRLSHHPSVTRSTAGEFDLPTGKILSNEPDDLLRGILGIDSPPAYVKKETAAVHPITVRVKSGHLKYARNPVIIGHFRDDGIVSAESVMDHLLNYKLSERHAVGLYPDQIGTNLVFLPEHDPDRGAVILGLGEPEKLTPFRLSRTVEQGCLAYVLERRNNHPEEGLKKVGISSLLVGSAYGYLSLSNSINAILEGVFNANKKIDALQSGLPLITEVEFIELYRDKALNAFYLLNQVTLTNNLYHIELQSPVEDTDEKRTFLPIFDEEEWWKRITAEVTKDEDGRKHFAFSASSGRARVEKRDLFANQRLIESLLHENSIKKDWDPKLTKTIFELIVPHDFKLSFRDQQNILLILDKTTAEYPWELLHYDAQATKPICVSAGMIRQLVTTDDRRQLQPVKKRCAFVIGDPVLSPDSGIPQLPEAEQEAIQVSELLRRFNYQVVSRIRKSFEEIITELYDEYKILHIASHGVIEHGPEKKTGILLSDDVVLTTAEINQISSTPELVFINCCHLGEIQPAREQLYRDKYRLAANIGTQLIENGVKAVVVTGWAVHDAAARLWAEVFYTKILEGEKFAEAVKAARAACFRAYPHSNTWGAYQCYGDPFYQLEKRRPPRGEAQPYILDKEILIDLENLINDTKSSRKRDDNLPERLRHISRRIDESRLRNVPITEQEAAAYAELEEYEIAIDKYGWLLTQEKAYFSVRSLEQWYNLQAQYLPMLKGKKKTEELLEQMEQVVERLTNLLSLGETRERLSLLGSAYKRKAMLADNPDEKREAVRAMSDAYRRAYLLKNKEAKETHVYPLSNWVVADMLLDKRFGGAPDRIRGLSKMEAFLKEKRAEAENRKEKKEFWDLIELINLNQSLLFFAEGEELDQLAGAITDGYREAWKIGGSPKQKNSEIAHMTFMHDTLEALQPKKKERLRAIGELLGFFEGID